MTRIDLFIDGGGVAGPRPGQARREKRPCDEIQGTKQRFINYQAINYYTT